MINGKFTRMTFHDTPTIVRLAAARGPCKHIRSGRNFDTMVLWIVIFGSLAVTYAAPLEEVSNTDLNGPNVESTTIALITNDVEGFAIDGEIIQGTQPPSPATIFVDVPQHTETELGSSVLLPCRTAEPVTECQWSWQPLPPIHLPSPDTNEHPSSDIASSETMINATTPTSSQSLPVRLFSAFGNDSNDCSVRFSSIKQEQTGFWTCAARKKPGDAFTSTEPAKLSISNDIPATAVEFIIFEKVVEAPAGSSAQIKCRTTAPVKECQWSWRQLNQSLQWNLEVKKFPAFGDDSTDCSIKFKNVLPEQEGLWTCGARANDLFIQSDPVRFLISEVEFVQLSRGIQIAGGESASLRCLVNKPVVQCEWSWRSTNSSKDDSVVKKFQPNADAEHDCSVKFKNVLHEEEGFWTCGVRLTPDGFLHEAPPATITLLPSAKVNIAESPENTMVQIGTKATLKCITSGRVERCGWLWRPLTGNTEEMLIREFPSSGDLGRDCSLELPRTSMNDQGFWSCQVSISSINTKLTSSSVKLTVYEQDAVKFSELSKDIQITSGGSVLLRCVTTSAVDQCRWSLTPVNSNTTVVVKQFSAAGEEARDCSVRLSHALAEQEGLWTCGAKIHGQGNYTDAPPAKLSLLEPEPVTVAMWSHPHQKVILACIVNSLPMDADCEWTHEPDVRIRQNDNTRKDRRNIQLNTTTGMCTLQFNPNPTDFGPWTCKFSLATENGDIDYGNSSVILLNTIMEDSKLGWIVGAATSIILLLMILTVTLVVCRARVFVDKPLPILETISAAENKMSSSKKKIKNKSSTAGTENLNNIVVPKVSNLYDSVVNYHETSHGLRGE